MKILKAGKRILRNAENNEGYFLSEVYERFSQQVASHHNYFLED